LDYIELKYPKPEDEIASDLLVSELAKIGFESFQDDDTFILAFIPEKDFLLENLYGIPLMKRIYDGGEIQIRTIKDQNWNAVWESNYPPVLIADRCFVHAPFHKPSPDAEFNILIKPKMAFGTAHHETTELMSELLLETNVKNKQVLDMGCGTALLAILASMKGASKVLAIDFDEWAFANSVENVEANNITNVEVLLGDAGKIPSSTIFDLVIANINKNTLLHDMSVYAQSLKKNGKLFMSGFYSTDLKDISKSADQNGLIFDSSRMKNSWTAAVYSKQ